MTQDTKAIVSALKVTRTLIAEAAATGFNYKEGDWPTRLFENQAQLSNALELAERLSAPAELSEGELREILAQEIDRNGQPNIARMLRDGISSPNMYLKSCLAAMRAVEARVRAPGWQDISTAPKPPDDGDVPLEFVLLLHDPDNDVDNRVQVGFWNKPLSDWQTVFEHSEIMRPTHWMPLPTPPAKDAGK